MTVQHAARLFEAAGFENSAQRSILLEAAYRADRRGTIRFSQSDIAGTTLLSRASVAKWFREFEDRGILLREGHGRYRLNMATIDSDDDLATALHVQAAVKLAVGAAEESARLRALMGPHQGIHYKLTDAGLWPVLADI